MDNAITGILKVNAFLLVAGFSMLAYIASSNNVWDYCGGYAFGAGLSAAGFTLLWSITYYKVTEVLGSRSRKDLTTQNIIGTGVASVAVLANVCFMAVAVTAATRAAWDAAMALAFGGLAAVAVMSIIWAVSDWVFVSRLVRGR